MATNNQQNTSGNNNVSNANSEIIIFAISLLTLLMTGLLCVSVYKCEEKDKKIHELKAQRDQFIIKYLDEEKQADQFAEALCYTKYKDFLPEMRYNTTDGRVCRIIINKENTSLTKQNSDWSHMFSDCIINKPGDLLDVTPVTYGKCNNLNMQIVTSRNIGHTK